MKDFLILTNEGSCNLVGAIKGRQLRHILRVDEKDYDDRIYYVQVTSNIMSITPSFIEGFFLDSIACLTSEQFAKKYIFNELPKSIILDVQRGLSNIKFKL